MHKNKMSVTVFSSTDVVGYPRALAVSLIQKLGYGEGSRCGICEALSPVHKPHSSSGSSGSCKSLFAPNCVN